MVRPVPHVGPTVGYRVDSAHGSVTYISDHQAPVGLDTVAPGVLELADGVDVLIHDAQYTRRSSPGSRTGGTAPSTTPSWSRRRPRLVGSVLFHHDPSHSDDDLDRLLDQARAAAAGSGVEVLIAREGLVLEV